MAEEQPRGVGKCANNHAGSFGYPTRPEEPYPFCPKCGRPMVWTCRNCEAPLPDDPTELAEARFCRHCGASYFDDESETAEPALGGTT
jgi:hypothetical protein